MHDVPVSRHRAKSLARWFEYVYDEHNVEHYQIIQQIDALCRKYTQARVAAYAKVVELCDKALILRTLKRGGAGYWCTDIIRSMREGRTLSEKAIRMIPDIFAAMHGRRNSKKYAQAKQEIEQALSLAITEANAK